MPEPARALRVAVLSGGRSSEHDVSRASGETSPRACAPAATTSSRSRLERDGTWRHDGEELALTPGRGLLGADVAFPVLHGPFGEDGTVQGLLELLDVPYVGSGVLASAVCLDKVVAKELMARAGIAQVAYAGVRVARWEDDRDGVLAELAQLGLPVFVKPARLGSSVGIAKVVAADELGAALDAAFAHDPCVIVEAMSAGTRGRVLRARLDPRGRGLRAGRDRHRGRLVRLRRQVRAGRDAAARARADLRGGARGAARDGGRAPSRHFGCSGLARADFFVEGERVLLNELNTMPGFTPTSVYAKLWEASGLGYAELVGRLCRLAIERHAEERSYRF